MTKTLRLLIFLASFLIFHTVAVAQTASEQAALLEGNWSCVTEFDDSRPKIQSFQRHGLDSLSLTVLDPVVENIPLGQLTIIGSWAVSKKDVLEYPPSQVGRLSLSEDFKTLVRLIPEEETKIGSLDFRGNMSEVLDQGDVQDLILVTEKKYISSYTDPEDGSKSVITCKRIDADDIWERYSIIVRD